jgi:hypothetical protein
LGVNNDIIIIYGKYIWKIYNIWKNGEKNMKKMRFFEINYHFFGKISILEKQKSDHKTRNNIWHRSVNVTNRTLVVDFGRKSIGGIASYVR